jgi:putative DNA primase/helicase
MNNDRIRDALSFVPPNDRDIWLKMGMAIKSELGDTGYDVWEAWSQQDESFNEKDARDVWKSIRANGKVTPGTLFHEARANGWRDDGARQKPTPEELAERRRIAAERASKEEAEIARERVDTAKKAKAILKAATPAKADHPYLSRKQVLPVATLREIDASAAAAILGYPLKSGGDLLTGRLVVVPIKRDNDISTLELIAEPGRKAALAGRGSKAGGFWASERLPDGDGTGLTLLIGEGVATVLSAREATGYPGVAALSSNNLLAVAKTLRERYPAAALVILADLVKTTGEPDPHASETARTVDGRLAVPNFGPDRQNEWTDFNDLHQARGREAVAECIARAMAGAGEPAKGETSAAGETPSGDGYASTVNLIRADTLIPGPIDWVWPGWLAAGKVHILGGSPGTGKTTLAVSLAATVTTGGRWPDGTRASVGRVAIWSGEDDPKDTLVPRLLAAGADTSRVHFVGHVVGMDGKRPFDPARDVEVLHRELAKLGDVRLLIVDPIVSAVMGDSHKNAEVRRGLQPLADLAVSMHCALLGITHFSKGTGGRDPVERITGSLAFGAVARIVMVAAKYKEEGEEGKAKRLFCRAKSNIGMDDGGFEFDLEQNELRAHPGIFASTVIWGGAVEGAARDLLAVAEAIEGDGEGEALGDAKRFLADLLADGPLPVKTIKADADGAGYSWATIRRAKDLLDIEATREGFGKGGTWFWRLLAIGAHDEHLCDPHHRCSSKPIGAQQNNVSTYGKPEHLWGNPPVEETPNTIDAQPMSTYGDDGNEWGVTEL